MLERLSRQVERIAGMRSEVIMSAGVERPSLALWIITVNDALERAHKAAGSGDVAAAIRCIRELEALK